MKKADWVSERILFGFMIIGGYLGIGAIGAFLLRDNKDALAVTHDSMTTLGPLVGVIVYAIWKTDKADKQNAQSIATLVSNLPAQPPTADNPDPLSGAAVPATQPVTPVIPAEGPVVS